MKWPKFQPLSAVLKRSKSYNVNKLCIILKHVAWGFQKYNFPEISKFRDLMDNNIFRENY